MHQSLFWRSVVGAAAICCSISATALDIPIPTPGPIDFGNLRADQWYLLGGQTTASAVVGTVDAGDTHFVTGEAPFPVTAFASDMGLSSQSRATTTATSLGAYATAQDPLLTGPITGALSYSYLQFELFSTSPTVTLNLHLTGSLANENKSGPKSAGPSQAAVSLIALGETDNGIPGYYEAKLAAAGYDGSLEGLPWLNQMINLRTTNQHDVTTYGQILDGGTLDNNVVVDQHMAVTADGVLFTCTDDHISPLCGTTYLIGFEILLFNYAQNGATADFSHTLGIDSIEVQPGTTLTFAPGQEIPVVVVPEPSSVALLALGLGALGLRGRACVRRKSSYKSCSAR